MAAVSLTPDDLAPFAEIAPAKATEMIADAVALAARVAPCILTEDFEHAAAAKAIIRGAILRWNEVGAGGYVQQQETTGPFSQAVSVSTQRKGMFWPSEINDLQQLCLESGAGGIFSYDTVPDGTYTHAEICALNFGADYCSCGAVLAGVPLYEADDS